MTLKKVKGKREVGRRMVGSRQIGRPSVCAQLKHCQHLYSQKQDTLPTQEDHQAQFFEHYHKEAEDYDKEFMKKHDEDLNTTLIFVSFAPTFSSYILTRVVGWFILCCHFCFHH